jgi:hypothetical protein
VDPEATRAMMIARIHGLTNLNGTQLAKVGIESLRDERADSERYYLRACLQESVDKKWRPEDIVKHHPRYNELCAKHEPPVLELQSAKSKFIKDKLIGMISTLYSSV